MVEYCSRCILHDDIPGVVIGEDGECNFCKLHDFWDGIYGDWGEDKLHEILDIIREKGEGKRYDCIVGISGGCDSSYLLDYLVEFGMKPLAVHFDNGWNTKRANENIKNLVQNLEVDLYRISVKQLEYNDLCRAFLFASVPDADIPNDIGITTSLYMAADRFECDYIMNAHSFRTEGTTPLGWTYMDGGYIESVHKRFGRIAIPSFPNLEYEKFVEWICLGIQRIRPLWYFDYDKKKAIEYLEKKFKWRWYGAHHHENLYTIFVGSYLWPKKFNMDLRYIEFSALIRSGFMTRREAWKELSEPPKMNPTLPYTIRRKLDISKPEWQMILDAPIMSHRDYETYQAKFKEDQEFFTYAMNQGKIPDTFYKKYVEGV